MAEEDPAEDKEDEEVLAAVAHYIMVHYEEKEGVKKKKKNYKPKSGQYQLEAGLCTPNFWSIKIKCIKKFQVDLDQLK